MSKLDFPSLPASSEAERDAEEWQTDRHERVLIHVRRIASVPPTARRAIWLAGAATAAVMIAAAAGFHYLYFLSHEDKPMPLFLLDSVFQAAVALLIALDGATLGTRIMRYLPRQSMTRLEVGLFAYGLGTGALSLMTALIGLLHGYYFPVLLAELIAPLVILHRDLAVVIRALLPASGRFALAELRPRSIAESAIFTVVMLMAMLVGEHALVPFWGFDVFMYHFALPQRFLDLHNLFGSPGIPQANLPYNNEMLNLLALNFKAEIGAAMVQTIFVGAMVLAIFALGLRLFSRQVAWLGMAIFLSTPVVLYYASSGLIDQHFAFMALIAVSALLMYHETHDRRLVILAGLLVGIGIGVKYQMIYLAGPMMIPFVWWSRPRERAGQDHAPTGFPLSIAIESRMPDGPVPVRCQGAEGEASPGQVETMPLRDSPSPPQWGAGCRMVRSQSGARVGPPWPHYYFRWALAVVINLALLWGCAAATFALWAVREWVQVGNPIYPLIWGGAEWNAARMVYYKSQFGGFGSYQHTPLLRHIVAIFDWFWHWQRYDYTPLPPAPVQALAVLAPVALVAPLVRGWLVPLGQRTRQGLALLLWLVVTSLLMWGFVDQLVPRYVLPTFGLIALLAAFTLESIVQWLARSLSRHGAQVALATASLIALIPGLIFGVQTRSGSDPSSVYTGARSYQSYVQQTQIWPSYFQAANFFNQDVPPDAKALGVNLAAGYFFDDPYLTPDMNLDVIFYLSNIAPSEAQKLAWLRAHGYTYLIYDRHVTQWMQQRRDTGNLFSPLVQPFESFLSDKLVLLRSFDGTDIYWIPPAGAQG